jgi:MoxR-like ATPase
MSKNYKTHFTMSLALYRREGSAQLSEFYGNPKLNNPEHYIPSQSLADAVNVAMMLGQPLLLTGEPGTGKTQLAYHLSHFFNVGKPLIFNVQTTSNAADLFYKYDALGHFQYNQNNSKALNPDEIEQQFITYNALGEAIRSKKRLVVLIDEIDKAPRDLPNDILFAIEHLSFRVPEVNKYFEADSKQRPVIIMTSNSEKNLPDAFMRRVVYFHIDFPSAEELLQILSQKTNELGPTDLRRIIDHFNSIRALKLKKSPSTAELIYWTLLLQKIKFPINKLGDTLNTNERTQLLSSYSVLAKNKEDFDLLKVL